MQLHALTIGPIQARKRAELQHKSHTASDPLSCTPKKPGAGAKSQGQVLTTKAGATAEDEHLVANAHRRIRTSSSRWGEPVRFDLDPLVHLAFGHHTLKK